MAALFPGEMKILIMKIGTDMKYNYLILALATAALCSCSGNLVETPVNDGETITIRAYQEGATETRTTLIDGGTQVYWEPSDEISVFFLLSNLQKHLLYTVVCLLQSFLLFLFPFL